MEINYGDLPEEMGAQQMREYLALESRVGFAAPKGKYINRQEQLKKKYTEPRSVITSGAVHTRNEQGTLVIKQMPYSSGTHAVLNVFMEMFNNIKPEHIIVHFLRHYSTEQFLNLLKNETNNGALKHCDFKIFVADEDGDLDDDFPAPESAATIANLGLSNFYVKVMGTSDDEEIYQEILKMKYEDKIETKNEDQSESKKEGLILQDMLLKRVEAYSSFEVMSSLLFGFAVSVLFGGVIDDSIWNDFDFLQVIFVALMCFVLISSASSTIIISISHYFIMRYMADGKYAVAFIYFQTYSTLRYYAKISFYVGIILLVVALSCFLYPQLNTASSVTMIVILGFGTVLLIVILYVMLKPSKFLNLDTVIAQMKTQKNQ